MSERDDLYTIIDWWEKLPKDFVDLETLFEKRRQLTSYYVEMGKAMRANYKQLAKLHVDRRIGEATQLITALGDIDPATEKYTTLGKAQAKSLLKIETVYRQYYEMQGNVEGLKILMETIKQALMAMSQEIKRLTEISNNSNLTAADNG